MDIKDDTNNSTSIVESVENTIYFYSGIDQSSILKLNKEIKSLDNKLTSYSTIYGIKEIPIYLRINSYGGSVFSGLSAMDNISACRNSVITIIDGICASAGTFLSVVGSERCITKHSYMLIHQISSGFWGKYEEIKDEKDNLDKLMETIKKIYLKKTNIPKKVLGKILKRDIYFDANTCLKYGLVDKII